MKEKSNLRSLQHASACVFASLSIFYSFRFDASSSSRPSDTTIVSDSSYLSLSQPLASVRPSFNLSTSPMAPNPSLTPISCFSSSPANHLSVLGCSDIFSKSGVRCLSVGVLFSDLKLKSWLQFLDYLFVSILIECRAAVVSLSIVDVWRGANYG